MNQGPPQPTDGVHGDNFIAIPDGQGTYGVWSMRLGRYVKNQTGLTKKEASGLSKLWNKR